MKPTKITKTSIIESTNPKALATNLDWAQFDYI
jgi:hypothetical protein